jgi:hypothetical protein
MDESEHAMPVKYLTRARAAEYIRDNFCIPCSVGTLDQYATDGTGPLYRRINRATLYDPADIDRWFEERATKPIRHAREVPWNKRRRTSRVVRPNDALDLNQRAHKDAPAVSTRQVSDQQPEA